MTKTSKILTFISTLTGKNRGESDTLDVDNQVVKNPQKTEFSGENENDVCNISQQQILDKLLEENTNLKHIIKHKNHYIKQLKNTIEELEKTLDNSLNISPKKHAENEKFRGTEKCLKPDNHGQK